MANRLMRKVRRAVRGRENSEEAAPMPAAALSAERAKPRERASAGERISTSSQLASLMVFFQGTVENFYYGQYEQYGKGQEGSNRRGDVCFEEGSDYKGRNEEQIGKRSHNDGGYRGDFYFICTICKAGGESIGRKGNDKQYEFGY